MEHKMSIQINLTVSVNPSCENSEERKDDALQYVESCRDIFRLRQNIRNGVFPEENRFHSEFVSPFELKTGEAFRTE